MKATRRRMFGLAAAVPAAVALPAIAAPIVEMHEADVMPLITIRRPIQEQLYSYVRTASVESVVLEPKAPFLILDNNMVYQRLVRKLADG